MLQAFCLQECCPKMVKQCFIICYFIVNKSMFILNVLRRGRLKTFRALFYHFTKLLNVFLLRQPIVRQSLECRDLVDEAKKYHLRPDLRSQMQSIRTRPRTGLSFITLIFDRPEHICLINFWLVFLSGFI